MEEEEKEEESGRGGRGGGGGDGGGGISRRISIGCEKARSGLRWTERRNERRKKGPVEREFASSGLAFW